MGIDEMTNGADAAERYLIVGGAGFLGSHFVDHLLAASETEQIAVYDNFSSGKEWHLATHADDPRLRIVRGDVQDLDPLTDCMRGAATVIHLAANPDIARAVTEPDIDFREGSMLTRNVLEAMRQTDCRKILYASGSGIYGNLGETEARESQVDIRPESTYGASKLACEALIGAYCHMFEMSGLSFRFANVVGARQTHGVGYDFLRKLTDNPSHLAILGDGHQSKSYLHAQDTVGAVMYAHRHADANYDVFNVATGDYVTVREIADMAVACLGLDPAQVKYEFAGGERGWKGDIPVVRFNTDKLQSLGWSCKMSSKEAIQRSLASMAEELRSGAD